MSEDHQNHQTLDPHERALVRCATTKGPVVMEFHRSWSPHGYDRAVGLFEKGFFDHSHFYRVVPNFLVQFGITYNPELKHQPAIPDDPKKEPPIPFELGTVSFAGSGPNSRTTQLFISYGSSPSLGRELWETPVGKVVAGIEHAQAFYSYGDMPPWGKGPVQGKIHEGRQYIEENFPLTDAFDTCQVERMPSRPLHQLQEDADQAKPNVRSATEVVSIGSESPSVYVVLAAVALVLLIFLFVKVIFPSQKKDNKRS